MIGDHHHLVGMLGVGHRIAERSAGRRPEDAVAVAPLIGCRRRDKGDIDVGRAVVDIARPSAMRTETHRFLQMSLADDPSDHRPDEIGFDAGDRAILDVPAEWAVPILDLSLIHI